MVSRNYKFVIFSIVLIFSFLPLSLFSQESSDTTKTVQSEQAVQKENYEKESPDLEATDVKMFVDKIEVNGQLEKPQALFFLPGSTPDIDDIQIEHSFFTEIFRPVEKRGRIQTKLNTEPGNKDRKDYIPW